VCARVCVLIPLDPPQDGVLPYRTSFQTIGAVAKTDGVLALWNGFPPYYGRCGGHTVGACEPH
jgi:solute carrier family 25 oxoglutarate transporter 11